MAVVGHHTSVNCWVQKNCFWNTLKLKKQLAVNWPEVCCCFYKQLGKSQADFARPKSFLQTWCSVLWCIFPHKLLERSKCTFKTTLQTVNKTLLTNLHIENTGASKGRPESRRETCQTPSLTEINLIGFKRHLLIIKNSLCLSFCTINLIPRCLLKGGQLRKGKQLAVAVIEQ